MKLFEDLPSINTPITAEALNQIKDKLLVVSPTEPTGDDREKIWIQKGKNRLNTKKAITQTIKGVTITKNTDGTITFNGTPTEAFGAVLIAGLNENLSGENTFSYKVLSGTMTGGSLRLSINDKTSSSAVNTTARLFSTVWASGETSGEISSTVNKEMFYLTEYVNYGCTFDNCTVSFQVEQGQSTEHEEYIEPKIYVKNDNDVYEEFISKEDTMENYLTTEQKIGTWIDGKLLYRKVIETTIPTVTTDGVSAWRQVVIPNIAYGRVVSSDSNLNATTRRSIILFHGKDNPALYVRSHFVINTSNNNGILEIESNNTAYNDKPVIAIVEYTKTTD